MILTLALVAFVASARAQEDYRSADPDRPIKVEDAYPLKLYEWEWQVGTRSEFAEGSAYGASLLLELKTGFARNWQAGVEAHGMWERVAGNSATRLEELAGHLLFNLNQESVGVPALSVRGDLFATGAGDLRRAELGGRLKGIATTSAGRTRLHANVAYSWASPEDGDDMWSGGVAFDHPIGLFSKAILGDFYVEIPGTGGPTRIWAEFGGRLQLTNTYVLDLGVTTRVDDWSDGRANAGLVVGISRTFGIAGLVRVPSLPDVRLQ